MPRAASFFLATLAALALLASTGCAAPQVVVVEAPAPVHVEVAAVASPPPTCAYGDVAGCQKACSRGQATSCNNLGAMVEGGLAPWHDGARAADLYARSCRGGASAGCANAERLASLERARAEAPPPAEPKVEAPPPPAPLVPPFPAPPVVSEDELRARCRGGERRACDGLPGIHLSGNVHIHGNVVMYGDVYLDGKPAR